ncbi:TonB-dependent receptor [Nibricoccus aquaticus]|uniref:TonB-dependent receptor n=1 Tax=Nibricoccus aquaticus TaxID=2576891 RepID=A0A290QG63_9BACT|nr:TonB-dependent receptor [Nibricoccus aquaticus]ATC64328.1 TonB-dependent receptor [Nibricoccus aquaticus]
MSSFRHLPLLLLAAALAHGQSTTPPAHSHSPADEPVALENLVVTATPLERSQAEIAAPTSVLTGRALALKLQPTLGESLAGQPGVASTYFGPGASRPVIRGLGGDRIRILQNGTGSIDASTTSPDHAVALDPLLIDRLEIVRGPAALLYGGNAVGGVVNVIDHRIATTLPDRPLEGRTAFRYSSVDEGKSAAVLLEGAGGPLAWHVDAYRRTSDDTRIPGFAESSALRAEETAHAAANGEPAPEFARDRLTNSAQTADGAAAGFSWIGTRGYLGFSASGHNTIYGIPPGAHAHEESSLDPSAPATEEEPPVRIDLRQRRLDLQGALTQPFGIFESARFKLGLADYRHQELEGAEIGTVFKNRGYDGRLELLHQPLGLLTGALGAQISHNDFSAIGDEAFLPPSHTASYALFAFEEATFDPLTWQFGARIETQDIEVRDGSNRSRDGDGVSLSTGLVWKLSDAWSLGTTLARTERQPNAQELFSNGPHIGTGAFEIGDETLGKEKSLALDVSLRRHAGFITGELTVFANRFDGFLFEQPTGAEQDDLVVYQYTQRDAQFYGAELETIFHLHESTAHAFDIRIAADTVRGKIRGTGENLPRITPRRLTLGFDYRGGPFSAGIDTQLVDRARNLSANETATDSYTLLGASLGWHFDLNRYACDVFVRANNLTDEEARNHVSFLKDVAPLPGRNITLGLRVSF